MPFSFMCSKHTTTGVTVNEALECLESDIENFLGRLIPEDYPYSHARMLRDYGSTAGNPTGHLKAMLTGNHCHFPVSFRSIFIIFTPLGSTSLI